MRIRRLVDLSVPVSAGTTVYPGDPVPVLTVHSTVAEHGFNLLHVSMGSQSGTHVDAPFHVDDSAARIDELPLEQFLGPGVVVDATGIDPRGSIGWDRVAPVADRLEPGVVVLLRTGWSEQYADPAYFDHPWLEVETCRRMLDRGVRTFCIDAPNIDQTPASGHPGNGFPVHHLIADAGGVIGENFCNLHLVDWPEPLVLALPIALEGADGAPVRAVAVELAP